MSKKKLCAIRIRKHTARKGGKYYYYHADVIATSEAAAVKATVEGRVTNWRMVDDFNPDQPESFEYYEVLYKLPVEEASFPREPLPPNPSHRWHRAVKEVYPSDNIDIRDTVLYYPKVRNLVLEEKLKKQRPGV
jgi:hypothetical protein